jgi:hypothetical protein
MHRIAHQKILCLTLMEANRLKKQHLLKLKLTIALKNISKENIQMTPILLVNLKMNPMKLLPTWKSK